ncbi:MAG TPA: hypothetical protein VGE51_08960 [Fontimonas sp.]
MSPACGAFFLCAVCAPAPSPDSSRKATDLDALIVRDGAADFAEAGEPRIAGLELDLWW